MENLVKKLKTFHLGVFRGAEGVTNLFDPLSTRYFGIVRSQGGGQSYKVPLSGVRVVRSPAESGL